MKTIDLVKLDPAIEKSLMENPAYLEAMMEDNWGEVANLVHQLVGRTLNDTPVRVNTLEWDGYFVIDPDTREVVGSCAYKGEPTTEGTVEIAYFTYPDFEGKGYATSMACKLIELAKSRPAISKVIAHTLPEKSASTRVLEKATMTFLGEVTDPDDGRVWRWQMDAEALSQS